MDKKSVYEKIRDLKDQFDNELFERQMTLMHNFHPTDDDFKKIIEMNDGLHDRFKMAYDQVAQMKKNIDEDIKSGKLNVSGYCIDVEYFFGYDHEDGIPTADYEMLMNLSDATFLFPDMRVDDRDEKMPDFETEVLNYNPELSFSIEWLDYPQLKDHYIYMFMHHIFEDSYTFCPADIPYLKPEDLQWQIVVEYEHFSNKDKDESKGKLND